MNADQPESPESRVIAGIARGSERQNLTRINTDERGPARIAGIARHRRHCAGSENQKLTTDETLNDTDQEIGDRKGGATIFLQICVTGPRLPMAT
jgi:hypothetical protein